jgi:hypothetical protein
MFHSLILLFFLPSHLPTQISTDHLICHFHNEYTTQYVLVSSILVGLATRYYFLSECCCLKFAVCIYWALSLTRGRVCNLQCNHSIVLVVQNPKPYFTVSSETPPTWRARFPYLYPPRTGWPSYTPGHWVPFTLSLTTRRYSNPPPTWRDRSLCI